MAEHALAAPAVAATLGVDPQTGLTEAEARLRLSRHGPNALPEPPVRLLWRLFLRQFQNPLIYLLFVAAAIAALLHEAGDALVILAVVTLNSAIGALQEGRAERAMRSLRRLDALRVRVRRGGTEATIPARELVPGDVLLLGAGDAIGADARLCESNALEIEEAALTGESLPASKDPAALPDDTMVADRRNMVYGGTHVTAGRGVAIVVATGSRSEFGRIAALAEQSFEPPTPLEKRIARLGRTLLWAAMALFVAVIAAGWLRGLPWVDVLMVAISQIVSVVPEGLPVAMTVALAVGMQRMAARGAIVRRLAAVETLGSTTVICTDKTGTLTRNEMTAVALVLPDGRELTVSGVGYAPHGQVLDATGAALTATDPALRDLLTCAVLCNDATLLAPAREGAPWQLLGDPTEGALLVLAAKAGLEVAALRALSPRVAEVPFDATAQAMLTVHQTARGYLVAIKGAAEVVAALDTAAGGVLGSHAEALSARALRVLAFALAEVEVLPQPLTLAALRGRARLVGLVGQIDPPRDEVAAVVAECAAAGIRTVMITGDHRGTGLAIARQVGIARPADRALDGRELEALTPAQLDAHLATAAVFARVQPAHKLRLIEAFQWQGAVVAMTGDGVNDAPALVRADVGVAMGRAGTEVAKEAADIVITDDRLGTVVSAVREGRVVYGNLQKVLLMLLATGLAEVLVLLAALLGGLPLPFAAVQILWNNVVTEGTTTVNLVLDEAEGDEMRRPPVAPHADLLSRELLARVVLLGLTIATITFGYFAWQLDAGVPFAKAQTATFTLLAVCEWFNVLNCRSTTRSGLSLSVLRNRWLIGGLVVSNLLQVAVVFSPFGNAHFYTVPLDWGDALTIGVLGSGVLWVEELRKMVVRRRARAAA
jgi:magnesium-transporting ATPase (P-type)